MPRNSARQQPVCVAAERVLTPSVRCDLVAQHHGQRAVGVGGVGGPLVQFSMQRSVFRRRLGHHVHEQLLDLAGLVDATRHLPRRRRMPGRHRCPQCFGVAGDPVGHLRHPPADQRPVLVGVGGHQVEHVAHRLQRRRDHVQVADIQPGVVQFDLQTESFAHRRDGHPVDVVNRAGSVEVPQAPIGPHRPGPRHRRASSR